MDVQRISIAEGATAFLVADLPTGEAVTVDRFFDMAAGASPILTSGVCTEIAGTGIYYWCLSNMQTAPAADMDIVWRMKSGTTARTAFGHLIIGGLMDLIKGILDKIHFDGDNILADLMAADAGVITATSIAAAALNGKGDWNVGKTGYSLAATTGLGAQTANITGNLSGSVGSIAAGGIAAASFAAGAIDAAAIKDAAIDLATFAADVKTGSALKAAAASFAAGAINGTAIDATGAVKIVGTAVALNGGAATIAGMLTKMADDNGGADYDATTDSLTAIAAAESGAVPTAEDIRVEMDDHSTKLSTIAADTGDIVDKMEAGSLAPDSVKWAAGA
jgi:hypothetical protein